MLRGEDEVEGEHLQVLREDGQHVQRRHVDRVGAVATDEPEHKIVSNLLDHCPVGHSATAAVVFALLSHFLH